MIPQPTSFRTLAARLVQKNVQAVEHLPEDPIKNRVNDPNKLIPPPEFYLAD